MGLAFRGYVLGFGVGKVRELLLVRVNVIRLGLGLGVRVGVMC